MIAVVFSHRDRLEASPVDGLAQLLVQFHRRYAHFVRIPIKYL